MPGGILLQDPYVGCQPVSNYRLTEKVGEGKIGKVYKAVRTDPQDVLACKVIPEGKLKKGWEREVEKVARLRGVANIVQYHSHGNAEDHDHRPFNFVLFDFIPGINLKEYLNTTPWPLDMAFIESVVKTILQVLYACHAEGIQHGDLHDGNILIRDPDHRLPDSPRTIWVSDFGYGGSHNELEPKDDFRQFFSIASHLLRRLDRSNLNSRDRIMHLKMGEFLEKKILEVDSTQGRYVGDLGSLLRAFDDLSSAAEREFAAAMLQEEIKEPGDYLVAEALGYRVNEWKNLFVPEFLATQDLLSKNTTVLTGARGCGKTMVFRRLTAFMDKVIGEPSGVKGADQFVGFYLNCRDLVEAFPWLPRRLNKEMAQQIIHYFHLAWLTEICKTLEIYDPERNGNYRWLDGFLTGIFGSGYHPLPQGADILVHAGSFLEEEKERCRLADLGKTSDLVTWPLARVDFLDVIQTQLESHVPWIGLKPLYMFLDDYTIPIMPPSVQRILNPIVFKRRSKLFFKISTEAATSFEREGLRGKPLELQQDFELIDLANVSLLQTDNDKAELLDKIFRPRINRHPILTGRNLGLVDVLGKMPVSNNKLALQMREAVEKGDQPRIRYYGANAFVGMWASDIRAMIQMFVEMLREANGALNKGASTISEEIQDKVYRSTGGQFLIFAESVTNPSIWERGPSSTKLGKSYGMHLRDITEAFINISRYELTKGDLVSNQGRLNPKQAFRLEIIDKFDPPTKVVDYYKGLVRWHIFLQDWRGKSVRGMFTPRLYLNRILIPYSNLTFSSHDNMQLSNEEFIQLLEKPKDFFAIWQQKRSRRQRRRRSQTGMMPLSKYDTEEQISNGNGNP